MTFQTPADRARALRASGTFQAVADALRALSRGPEDRITKKARELEEEARHVAQGLRDAVLMAETGGAGG